MDNKQNYGSGCGCGQSMQADRMNNQQEDKERNYHVDSPKQMSSSEYGQTATSGSTAGQMANTGANVGSGMGMRSEQTSSVGMSDSGMQARQMNNAETSQNANSGVTPKNQTVHTSQQNQVSNGDGFAVSNNKDNMGMNKDNK